MAYTPQPERNLRLFLQSEAGADANNEVMGQPTARKLAEVPGEIVHRAIVFGHHTIARSSTLLVQRASHTPFTYYDPSQHGQASNGPGRGIGAVAPVPEPVIHVIEEEQNLQGFQHRAKADVSDPFADIGIIYADEDVIADEEDADPDNQLSIADANAFNAISPEQTFLELSEKGAKNFGISKQELASFQLTLKQLKALYVDVTGKSPVNVVSGKMKRRVRDVANQSYSDFTRVTAAVQKIVGK
jgi:hypothetical protein